MNDIPHHVNIRLSQEAWEGLLRKANRVRFVLVWLAELPSDPSDYEDTRPDWMKEQDNILAELGRLPQWSYEQYKFRHSIAYKPAILNNLYQVAMHWHVSNHLRSDSHNKLSRVGAVLEAIGTDLLTPHGQPVSPPLTRPDQTRHRQQKDLMERYPLLG